MAGKIRIMNECNLLAGNLEMNNKKIITFMNVLSLYSNNLFFGQKRVSFYSIFGILTLFVLTGTSSSQEIRQKVNEGNALYNEEKYEEALNNYQDALLEDPQSEIAHFNQGDALYKLDKHEEAIEAYQKVIGSEDRMMDSKAYYNIGNSYFKQDKLQESIEAYKKALDINPNDQDAKYNLELARAKLKESSEKQQQQPQQNSQEQQQQQGQQEEQQNQEGQENQEQEGEQKQAQAEQEQQQQQSGEENQDQNQQQQGESLEESQDKMTKEDAERILDALKNDEQDTQKLRRPAKSGRRNVDKDW